MKSLRQIIEGWEDRKNHWADKTDFHKVKESYGRYAPQHEEAIRGFQTYSRELNSYHWDKHQGETDPYLKPEHIDRLEKQTNDLDTVLQQKKTPKNLTVHSGIGYDPRAKMNSEGIVHHPAYLSTSFDTNTAENFSIRNSEHIDGVHHRHVLKINVPKGTPSAMHFDGEQELVLPRGTNLRHIKTTKKQGTATHGEASYKYINHIHHMEVV